MLWDRGPSLMKMNSKGACACALAFFYGVWFAPLAQAYSFDMIVPDVRQPASISGGSSCPVRAHQLLAMGSIAVRWSTALNSNPVTVLTQNQTASVRLTEIEQVAAQSLAGCTAVSGAPLSPATLPPPSRAATKRRSAPNDRHSTS